MAILTMSVDIEFIQAIFFKFLILHGKQVLTPLFIFLPFQYVSRIEQQDLPTPFCKEARLTFVHMNERVTRTFYFIVSSPNGVAEAQFHVNYTRKRNVISNAVDGSDDEELRDPEEIHFPAFGRAHGDSMHFAHNIYFKLFVMFSLIVNLFCSNVFGI